VNISSTDGDDAVGGSGARTVFIQGLDSNYDIVNEVFNMDGTNNVTSVNQYLRMICVRVREVGSSGVNEGTISVTQNSLLLSIVEIDDGQCQTALFTVPNNYTGYFLDCYFTSSEDKPIEYEIAYRNLGWSWRSFLEINCYRTSFQHKFAAPIKFSEKTDIRIRAKAGSSSGEVGSGFVLLLIHDDYANDITSMNATQAVREVGSITVSDPENQMLLYVGVILIIAVALAALASGRKW